LTNFINLSTKLIAISTSLEWSLLLLRLQTFIGRHIRVNVLIHGLLNYRIDASLVATELTLQPYSEFTLMLWPNEGQLKPLRSNFSTAN